MAGKIIIAILMIPVYGAFIWSYVNPEESMLFGKRWMYREEPELSKKAIGYTKMISLIALVGIPIALISIFFNIMFLKFILIIGFPIAFVLGVRKIFTS